MKTSSRPAVAALALLAALLMSAAAGSNVNAQSTPQAAPLTPEAALQRLFTADHVQADWFASSVLSQVPVSVLDSVVAGIKASLGNFQSAQSDGNGGYTVTFDKGTVPATLTLDSQGRFTGLVFGQPHFNDPATALAQAVSGLKALPGSVSLLVTQNGQDSQAVNADQPLAVGSTFKLAVLAALRQQIDAGQRSWSDVVNLQPGWKTLPSGVLQDWPDGTPLTLQTLASVMISISDNTAADGLMDVVGRAAVEAFTPGDLPLLTPKELFALKDPNNSDLLGQWRAGDVTARRALLPALDQRPNPSLSIFQNGPIAPDAEYFFSARDLCGLMSRVADLPLMGINPGLADPSAWQQVAFKGGSEPGVINITQQLVSNDGRTICVSATWNNTSPVDESQFNLLLTSLLGALS